MKEIKCWEKRQMERARCPYFFEDEGLECPSYPSGCNEVVEFEEVEEDEEE